MEVSSRYEARGQAQAAVRTQKNAVQQSEQEQPGVAGAADDFSSFMRSALGGAAKTEVNEEELFAALIYQRLQGESSEAANYYQEQKSQFLNSLRRADGYVSVELAAVKALEATLAAGHIDTATAERINGEAFIAAQLDDNHDALYDSRGSADDPTIAVSEMEAALLSMRTVIEQIEAGDINIEDRPLGSPITTSANGSNAAGGSATGDARSLDGPGGFLWKPVSESDGKLVVLLPTDLKGLIDRVEIHSDLPADETTKLAQGRFTGDQHNGGRPHFRFDKPGGSYGSDLHVVVFKDDGTTVTWDITNGKDRHD